VPEITSQGGYNLLQVLSKEWLTPGDAHGKRIQFPDHMDITVQFRGRFSLPVIAKITTGIAPFCHFQVNVQKTAAHQVPEKGASAPDHVGEAKSSSHRLILCPIYF
jgi:hypothetical protein